MSNYLKLNGKKIELTAEQVKEIENSFGFNRVKLGDIAEGETFKVGDFEFIVLEQHENTTSVILKDFWKTLKFDNNSNNYKESDLRTLLNTDFYHGLSKEVKPENVVKHTVDLTADDGRIDYDSCEDYISLLTCNMYRKYVYILDKYKKSDWWWLATPYSTKSNCYDFSVRCVCFNGTLYNDVCRNDYGVRPFCILKSNIFVSK